MPSFLSTQQSQRAAALDWSFAANRGGTRWFARIGEPQGSARLCCENLATGEGTSTSSGSREGRPLSQWRLQSSTAPPALEVLNDFVFRNLFCSQCLSQGRCRHLEVTVVIAKTLF